MMALALFAFAGFASAISPTETKSIELFSSGKHFELALNLERLGLKQMATVEYLEAANSKEGKAANEPTGCKDVALSGLFNLADRSDDYVVLNFLAESVDSLPCSKNDSVNFRRGEFELHRHQYQKAVQFLSLVSAASQRYFKARYLRAIAYLTLGKSKEAMSDLEDLVWEKRFVRESDFGRNAAIAGLARIHYKKENWSKALEYYKMIPKDSELWHQVLTEMNWTNFRLGNFREVLGGLAGLHSPLYEDHFLAGSILLRSFVYLSICHLDEMAKTLDLYELQYLPLNAELVRLLAAPGRYSDLNGAAERAIGFLQGTKSKSDLAALVIPLPLIRTLLSDGEFTRAHKRVESVSAELNTFAKLSVEFKNSALGREGFAFLQSRLNEAVKMAGQKVQSHLIARQKELTRLNRQYEFARYELVSATEREMKNPQSGAGSLSPSLKEVARHDFLSRGLVLYPFRGEYWLDEPGNYRFIGQSRCAFK